MFNFLKKHKTFTDIAKKQIKKNKKVLGSLRAYDKGEKKISIDHLKRRLPDIRNTAR